MKLVLVEWVDSHSGRGWRDMDVLESGAALLHVRSVGWVLKETKDIVLLVAHLTLETGGNTMLQGQGDICIPRVAIKRIKVLKEKP